MRESMILQKYTDVQKTIEVGSAQTHGSNSKCIEANNTANTQLLFLLRKHTYTTWLTFSHFLKIFTSGTRCEYVHLSANGILTQKNKSEEHNPLYFSNIPI